MKSSPGLHGIRRACRGSEGVKPKEASSQLIQWSYHTARRKTREVGTDILDKNVYLYRFRHAYATVLRSLLDVVPTERSIAGGQTGTRVVQR